jgi:hypothetical protein
MKLGRAFLFSFLLIGSQLTAQFSGGIEGAIPVGEFSDAGANYGIGISASFEKGLNDRISILVNAGFLWYDADDYELTVSETDPDGI